MELRVAALVATAVAAYWPSSSSLWHYWIDHPYFAAHGVLVTVLGLWLLYRARDRIASQHVEGRPWALLPLLACGVAAVIFWRLGALTLQMLTLPVLMLLAVFAAFGPAVTRATAVPVGFLYFAMPVWDLLTVPLQKLVVAVVILVAPVMGIPVTVSGFLISLPRGLTFAVTEWCSGLGLLVQGVAVATLLGELEQAPLRRRLWLIAAMVVLALVTNWIRVLTLIHVGYATNMRHLIVTRYHVEFGYVLYVIALVLFVWVATRSAPDAAPRPLASAAGLRPPASDQFRAAAGVLVSAPLAAAALGLVLGWWR